MKVLKHLTNRVYRIMRDNRTRAKIGRKQRKLKYGVPSKISENVLKKEFNAGKPDESIPCLSALK